MGSRAGLEAEMKGKNLILGFRRDVDKIYHLLGH
jgi:hypothetical protein